MNTDDYLFVYFALLDKTAASIPTYDKVVINDLMNHNAKFAATVAKYKGAAVQQILRQIFTEFINARVFQGTISADEIIISNNTPLAIEILQRVGDQSFWQALKKTADKWQTASLTSCVLRLVEN